MNYEEKVINGKLCYRGNKRFGWHAYTAAELVVRYKINNAQQGVHPTGGTPCEVCGFAPGWHDLEKHFPVLPASG